MIPVNDKLNLFYLVNESGTRYVRRANMIRLPRIGTDVESKAVNSRSMGKLYVGFEVIGGVRICVAHHKVGDDIFLSVVPFHFWDGTVSKWGAWSSMG